MPTLRRRSSLKTLPRALPVLAIAVLVFARAVAGEATDSVDQALNTADGNLRKERVEELLAKYRNEPGDDADLAVLRLLNAKAKMLKGGDKRKTLDELLARHDGTALRELDDKTLYEVAIAMVAKAGVVSGVENKARLLEPVRMAGSGSRKEPHRYQAYTARMELAKIEPDPAKARKALLSLVADLEQEKDWRFRAVLASVMNRLAGAAANAEKPALYARVIERFGDDANVAAREQAVWAEWQRNRLAKPPERFAAHAGFVGKYKDAANESMQDSVRGALRDMASLLEKDPAAPAKLDGVAAGLEGTAAADKRAMLLQEAARLEPEDAKKLERYRALIESFESDTAEDVGRIVANSVEKVVKLSPDKKAAVAMAEEYLDRRLAAGSGAANLPLAGILEACADAAGDRDGKLRFLDRLLALDGVSYRTRKTLNRKAELLEDPGVVAAYYDAEIASAKDDAECSRFMYEKILAMPDHDDARAAAGELAERFADSGDPEIGSRVIAALDRMRMLDWGGDGGDLLPLYGRVEAAFASAEDAGGMTVLANALLGTARLSSAKSVKIALYDRVLALHHPRNSEGLEQVREKAVEGKSEALDDSGILAEYYRERAAASLTLEGRVGNLLLQADNEPSRRKKIELYRNVEEMIGGLPGRNLGKFAVAAIAGQARATGKRDEAVAHYRRALARIQASETDIDDYPNPSKKLFEELIQLTPDTGGKIRLYDEMIAFNKKPGKRGGVPGAVEAMMKKAMLLDARGERIALLDEAVTLAESEKNNERLLCDALLAKADAVEELEEKVGLYDRVMLIYQTNVDKIYSSRIYTTALKAKAKALGDSAPLSEKIDEILKLPRSGDNLRLASELADGIESDAGKIAAYDRIIAAYANEKKTDIVRILQMVEFSRARFSGGGHVAFSRKRPNRPSEAEILKTMEESRARIADRRERFNAFLAKVDAEPDVAGKVRLLDEYVDSAASEGSSEFVSEVLFFKAAQVPDKAGKNRVYEDIISRAMENMRDEGRFFFSPGEEEAEKAYREMAALLDDDAQRREMYAAAVRKHSDMMSPGAESLTLTLRREGVKLLPGRKARIAELKKIYDDYYGKDSYSLKNGLREILEELAALMREGSGTAGGGAEAIIDFLAPARDKLERIRLLLDRADGLEDVGKRRRAYEDIADRYDTDPDPEVAWAAAATRLQAVMLLDNAGEKVRRLDEMLAGMRPKAEKIDIARVLRAKADSLADPGEKAAAFGEIVALLADARRPAERREYFRAMIDRADLLPDPAERTAAYSQALEGLGDEPDAFSRRMLETVAEKLGAEAR